METSHSQYKLNSNFENNESFPYQLGSLVATGKNIHYPTTHRLLHQKNAQANFVGQRRYMQETSKGFVIENGKKTPGSYVHSKLNKPLIESRERLMLSHKSLTRACSQKNGTSFLLNKSKKENSSNSIIKQAQSFNPM